MSYADRVNQGTSKPPCYGEHDQFDAEDPECVDCRYIHACRREVEKYGHRSRSRSSTVTRRRRPRDRDRPRDSGVEVVDYDHGHVGEHETAFARFGKDALGGALRGGFYEMYRFWTRYRIP